MREEVLEANRHFFFPVSDQEIFHYCSMDSFASIVKTGKIRFSDITMMNDYSELRWGYSSFRQVAISLIDRYEHVDGYDELKGFLEELFDALIPTENTLHPLIACFSLDGDVLSQWRSYADDGQGVAIGFKGDDICQMSAHFQRCQYTDISQDDYLEKRLLAAFHMRSEAEMSEHARHLYGMLPALKNPAFNEEQEVRGVHMLLVEQTSEGIRLFDPGGKGFGQEDIARDVQFSVRKNGLVAHIDLPFFASKPKGISRVMLGPKNQNHGNNVSAFMMQNGFENVRIERSAATYR